MSATTTSDPARHDASAKETDPGVRAPRAVSIRPALAVIAIVAVVVAWTFWPVLESRALFSDDFLYVVQNETVRNPSWSSAARFLREVTEPTTVPGYYEPWPMITLMLDCAMGADARTGPDGYLVPFRRTALVLHVLNSVLVGLLIYLLFREPFSACVVGVLFGVHPLQVESVAWISQRKTLMASLFALSSLVLYVRYAQQGSRSAYGASLLLYLLALMSKPTALPLPVLLLVMDYWPLRRLRVRCLVEKIPFFALAFASGVLSLIALKRTAYLDMPAEVGLDRIPLILGHNIAFYMRKIFWPTDLSAFYPFPDPMVTANPVIWISLVASVLLIVGLLVSLWWTRAAVGGWAFFFLGIFPAMGVFKVTPVIAADRYVYLPLVGIGLTVGYALSSGWTRSGRRGRMTPPRAALAVGVLLIVGGLLQTTRAHLASWSDNVRLFQHMVAFGPDQFWIQNGLANAYLREGRVADAIGPLRRTVALQPSNVKQRQRLARTLLQAGQIGHAVSACREGLVIDPDAHALRCILAEALNRQGRFAESMRETRQVLRKAPATAQAHYQLGVALFQLGKPKEALPRFEEAVRLKPDFPQAHWNLAAVLVKTGQLDRAMQSYRRVVELQPDNANAHYMLGALLQKQGRPEEARKEFREALKINPRHARARRALGG